MFGYVRVNSPELKVKEYEAYRGVYCGLCRAMGKCTGQCSRMTLSYDFAFLALIRIALENTETTYSPRRCLAHPLTRRQVMEPNATLHYCAQAAALLNYHKVRDDLADEGGVRRLRAILALPFVAHARRRALRAGLAPLDTAITEGLARLSQTEKADTHSVDLPADAFGEILAAIMSYGLDNPQRRIAHALGSAVGKWIYLADALEDWEADAKRHRYNPFFRLYGTPRPTKEQADAIRDALKNGLFAAESAMDLVEFPDETGKNILYNILYLGMPERIDQIPLAEDPAHNKERTHHANERSL